MSAWVNVIRYQLLNRGYVVMPWVTVSFIFTVELIVLALIPAGHSAHRYVGGLASIYVVFFVCGLLSITRSLALGLSLGLSRRSYYLGTVLLGVTLATFYGLVLTMLQVIERVTGGWGVAIGFFQVPYILNGPWYLTWLTSVVVLTLLFVGGIWVGLVYRRWNVIGLWAFAACQTVVLLAGALVATRAHAWQGIGRFFTALSAAGLTGVLAAAAVVLLAGGYATIRRVTV